MAERVHAQGEVIYDTLRRMVRQILARKAGGHLLEATLDELDLSLPLSLKGARAEPEVFSRELVAALEEQIDTAIQAAAAFRPGHTFCHRCEGAACEHSSPPSSQHVFVSYTPTGTPAWLPFAQYCLELHHPDVDRLYGSAPVFVTLVQDAATLRGRLLDAWQNPRYDLLGQIVAGYFRVPGPASDGRGVLALTFQVTAAHTSTRGRLRLGLNILGRTPSGEELGLLWERYRELPWRRSVQWAQGALSTVARPSRRGGRRRMPSREEIEERVSGILAGLARRLEREQRGRTRRTAHAERRHESGDRPTRKAVDDVRAARLDAYLVDERSGALVILGERGRTHFFTPEGRLVSSVRYSRDAIERKRRLGHWRLASPEEAAELQRGFETLADRTAAE